MSGAAAGSAEGEVAAVTDLIPWLHEQLDAAEASTRTLLYWAQQTILTLQEPRLLGKEIPGWHDWPDVERMCQQRLAELEAARQVVRLHADQHECTDPRATEYPYVGCQTVRVHAVPFASQPGYQEGWRPSSGDVGGEA